MATTTPDVTDWLTRSRSLPGWVGTLAFLGAVLLAEAILAAALLQPRLLPLLGLAAAAGGLAVLLRWPMAGAIGVLVLVASTLSPTVVTVPLGPLSLRPYELALGALLVVSIAKPQARTWGGRAGAGLLAFLVVVAISAGLAVTAGEVAFGEAFEWSRRFAALLLFFVVVRLFPRRRDVHRLLTAGAIIGAATGLMGFLYALGVDPGGLLGAAAVQEYVSEQDAGEGLGGLERIRMPGVALAFVLFWYAVLRLQGSPPRARLAWLAVIAGISLNLAISFNRNMWVAVLLGLAVLLLIGGTAVRRPFLFGSVAVAATAATITLFGVELDRSKAISPIVARGETLLDVRRLSQESSLQARVNETRLAWNAFSERPVTGIGAGTSFGASFPAATSFGSRPERQLFLHNQYLYLLLIGGIPALVAFLVFLLSVLGRVVRDRRDPLTLSLGVGVVMSMASAIVMISFAEPNMAAALGLVAGGAWVAGRAAGDRGTTTP